MTACGSQGRPLLPPNSKECPHFIIKDELLEAEEVERT